MNKNQRSGKDYSRDYLVEVKLGADCRGKIPHKSQSHPEHAQVPMRERVLNQSGGGAERKAKDLVSTQQGEIDRDQERKIEKVRRWDFDWKIRLQQKRGKYHHGNGERGDVINFH